MKTIRPIHFFVTLILLVTLVPTSKVLSQAETAPRSSHTHTKDKNSEFYLLLNDEKFHDDPSFQAAMKQIDRLGEAQDLQGLIRLADHIELTWGEQADTQGYFGLMDEVTNVLRSHTFAGAGTAQYALTKKYVLATLAHDHVPLDITARLLPRLIPEETITLYKKPFNASDWVQSRRKLTPLWLQTRQRLKLLVDSNYDMTSPVLFDFSVSPDDLKNRKKMVAHQQAMEVNNRKLQGRNDQRLVRLQDRLLSPTAEDEVILYYSQAPFDTPELTRFLDTYVEDSATKQRILDQVAKNIASATQ